MNTPKNTEIYGKTSNGTFRKNGSTPITIFKNEAWTWETEQKEEFRKIKQMLIEGLYQAHYAKDKDNIVTTDASTTGLRLHNGKNKIIQNR